MGKQGVELSGWDQSSSSSTVLLDPAALLETCKQRIQVKDGIPAGRQRLIFACRVANPEGLSYTCKKSSTCPGTEENAGCEFVTELRGWEAILKDDNRNIARLLHPVVELEEQVAAEDERKASQLSCQTARELRSMGIPCNVYYLYFSKWIPAPVKNGKCCQVTSSVEIQIDKEFHSKSFEILLFGRLNGSYLPMPFVYRMNGGEVASQVSMQEQMAQYRQGQKTRHRLGLSTQSVGKGVEGRDVHAAVEDDGLSNGYGKRSHADDYYCPCGKDLDFNVLISKDHQFKCIRSFVLKVIQVPADAARKPDQSASQVPGRCERGISNGQHDPSKYCVSSTGAISRKSESTVSEDKAALAEFLPTKCCQCAGKSSRPREGNESSGSCSLEVPSPTEISEAAASDRGIRPQNSSTDNGTEGLPIVEEPLSQLLKKKKKKRKGKRSGKRTTESSSSPASKNLDSMSALSTMNGSVDSCTQPATVECQCLFRETAGSESTSEGTDLTPDSPLMKDIVRELSTCGDKSETGVVNIFRCKVHCFGDSKEDLGSSTIRAKPKKIGQGYSTAEQIIAEIVSDKQTIASSKQSSKDSFGTNTFLKHGGEFLPVGRNIKSSTCLCTGSCDVLTDFRDPHALSANADNAYMCSSTCPSNDVVVSQPFVGPIMVEMGFQSSAPPARSLGDRPGPHYPSRELFGNLEAVSDTGDLVGFSDTHFSTRGGYNGSGAGSRNGRSGADGSGNRSHGRGGSEDRKGASGYHGGGQGSSGSNHGSGPGGSSTSGSSGGSGGGNGNPGGGRGGSGGSWDGRRSDEDGGNGNKDGDNDERCRNSFQASSNGEAAPDSVPRKKGISSLDNRGSHGRKGFNGGGDQLMNGTSSCHVSSSSGDKENVDCWHKQNPDEWTEDSHSPSQPSAGSEERIDRTRADQKNGPPSIYVNGFLQHETKVSNLTEGRDGVEPYPHKRPTPSHGSFAKALKQNISDEDHLSTSSSQGSKESRNEGTLPGMGAWEKNSWDDQQPLYNRHVSEGTSQVGASKGKQYIKPTRNGVQMRGHSSDSDTVNHSKSVAAPATNGVQDKPSYPNGYQDNFTDSKILSNNDSTRNTDGRIYQSSVQSPTMASEQITQSRMSLVSNVSVRQHGEARLAPDESSLRLCKTRKTSGDQERLQVRDKAVGDRERTTTHWPQQKWVPVDHKSGSSGKVAGPQCSSSGNARTGVPAEGDITENNERQQGFVNTKEVSNSEEDTRRGDVHSSSSLTEVSHSTSPSKSLRRFQTFPSSNNNILSRVSDMEAQAVEPKEPGATMASERPAGHLEQANLRGLLPRERTMDNSSTQIATQSTVGGYSTSVQSPRPGEQKNKLRLDDRVGKGSTATVKPVLSPAEEETRRAVREILNAVQSSCRDRRAAEQIVREVGCPMAEFEKVLGAVAPSFCFVLDSSLPTKVSGRGAISSREHSIPSQTCESDEFSLCRCGVSHIPLKSIWQWYEDPSYYGIEVNAVNSQKVQRNGEEEEPFLAYFVPYISALQIFGASPDRDYRNMDDFSAAKGNVDAPSTSQPKEFSCSNMLATLFPTPGKSDESLSHGMPPCTASRPRRSNFGDEDCGIKLLYEFFDADQPQMRQPLYLKVKELVEGGSTSNSYSRGDPVVLDRLCLGDIHPASWFAVAWYPIYRIAEGPLKAVFLTYHSFNHFAPQSSLSCLTGGTIDVVDSISMPVVGLECYNLQGEPWLSMGGRFAKEATKVSERLTANPILCLEKRINSLQEVAAGMAKGIPDSKSATPADGTSSIKFRHSDYEFFVKRRTAVRQMYKFEH